MLKKLQALARSLTLGRDVILLDDVFSALDRRTRLQIAENLFRPKKDLSDSSPAIVYSTNDCKSKKEKLSWV